MDSILKIINELFYPLVSLLSFQSFGAYLTPAVHLRSDQALFKCLAATRGYWPLSSTAPDQGVEKGGPVS